MEGAYPRTWQELERDLATAAACRAYLEGLRWADGFTCPGCGHRSGWRVGRGWMCARCSRQTSVTAGTIFHRSKLPLPLWFRAAWLLTGTKSGVSARSLQRVLGLTSYETAWLCLHKFRRAMVRPQADRLQGEVEVDETLVGGPQPLRRGRSPDRKAVVLIAVERKDKALGRVRLRKLADASKLSLHRAIPEIIAPGSTLITDGWTSYEKIEALGYRRHIVPRRDERPENLLPGCHRVASLLKRWLLGTHQGGVRDDHLQAYLDEFTFRFNRRSSTHRGLLFYRLLQNAVVAPHAPYRSIANHNP